MQRYLQLATLKTQNVAHFDAWAAKWVHGAASREEYVKLLAAKRVEALGVKKHAYAAQTDYGY